MVALDHVTIKYGCSFSSILPVAVTSLPAIDVASVPMRISAIVTAVSAAAAPPTPTPADWVWSKSMSLVIRILAMRSKEITLVLVFVALLLLVLLVLVLELLLLLELLSQSNCTLCVRSGIMAFTFVPFRSQAWDMGIEEVRQRPKLINAQNIAFVTNILVVIFVIFFLNVYF